jgi:hypothetical protein
VLPFTEGKPPFAETVIGMRLRRCKKALDDDPLIDDLGKTAEFTVMHAVSSARILKDPLPCPLSLKWSLCISSMKCADKKIFSVVQDGVILASLKRLVS